jgi:hypothetical protein
MTGKMKSTRVFMENGIFLVQYLEWGNGKIAQGKRKTNKEKEGHLIHG